MKFKAKRYLVGGVEFEVEYFNPLDFKLDNRYNFSILPTYAIGHCFHTWGIGTIGLMGFRNVFGAEAEEIRIKFQKAIFQSSNAHHNGEPCFKDERWVEIFSTINLK